MSVTDSEDIALMKGLPARQLAADRIRAAILNGEMSPGQRLVEAELADMYGVTRASVRAASDDLIDEGLLERIHNRGARVRTVSVEEAVAILECRRVLEGLIAARAAELVSDEQAADLRTIGDAMEAAVASGDVSTYSRLNSRLHASVGVISGHEVASNLIHRLRSQIVRHQFRLSQRPGRPQISLGEHLAIIEGIVNRDPDRAETAARAHVASVISALSSEAAA